MYKRQIIESIRGLINRIGKLTGLLTGFIGSISNFLVDFGTQIGTATANLFRFDGDKQYAEASESLTETENGLTKLRRRLIESFNLFTVPQNFGLNSFDEGLIIKSDDPDAEENQEEDPNQVQDNKVTDEKDTSKNKPKGFMRGLTGAIDFATFGMTDLDKRGDLFGNKEEEKEEVAEFDPGAYTAVTDSEAKEQIEKEDNADMVSGIKDQSFIKDVESQQAQSQGETVETVNKEREDAGEQDKQVQGLRTKIEGFMSNMFGTKRKREDKTDNSGIDAEIEKTAAQLKGAGSDLKSNMAKYAESIKKDGDSSKITPMMRDRSNLQGKRKSGRDTIYIIEKPVKIGGGDSGSVGGGGGGGSSPSFSNGSGDNTNNLMKKIQKVILQS